MVPARLANRAPMGLTLSAVRVMNQEIVCLAKTALSMNTLAAAVEVTLELAQSAVRMRPSVQSLSMSPTNAMERGFKIYRNVNLVRDAKMVPSVRAVVQVRV